MFDGFNAETKDATAQGTDTVQSGLVEIDENVQIWARKFLRAVMLASILMMLLFILITCLPAPFTYVFFPFVTRTMSIVSHTSWLAFQPVSGWYPLQVMAYSIVTTAICFIPVQVLNYSIWFFLRRHFWPSGERSRLRDWSVVFFKILALKLIPLYMFIELVSLLLIIQPQAWWFWAGIARFIYSVLQVKFMLPFILPLFYKVTPVTDSQIVQQLNRLTARTRTSVQGLFILVSLSQTEQPRDRVRASAYLIGWGKASSIVMTRSIMTHFKPEEIEIILAHELGHHVHVDVWKRMIVSSLVWMGVLLTVNIPISVLQDQWFSGINGTTPVSTLYGMLTTSLLLPCVALVAGVWINRGYSRATERKADEFALRLTKNVVAFKNCMIRLANMNPIPVNLTVMRGTSHPDIGQRLKLADEFAQKLAGNKKQQGEKFVASKGES